MNETRRSPGEIVYLACPYTDPDPEVRKHRFDCVTMAAAHLIEQGLIVYSPLTMTHPVDLVLAREGETLGSDYWVRFDEAFMAVCSRMVILKLDGWESSSGVRRETEWFVSHGQPIEYLEWSKVEESHGTPRF
jgi:uncharacterized protein DUF1937